MDLEEWEILPDDGFLQIHDDGGKMIFSRKYTCDSKNEFNMNHFICPSPQAPKFVDITEHSLKTRVQPNQNFQETPNDDQEQVIITTKVPFEIKVPNLVENHDQFTQVFIKNMKMGSPKSNNNLDSFDEFEEKEEDLEVVNKEEMVIKKIEENSNGGLNLLNKSLNGIGAICSFGVAAAATICIIFMGNHQKHKQNQKLRFQIFTDDKRMKQVVQHATRLNEAISAVRGVPVTRAHITVGGYYDAL